MKTRSIYFTMLFAGAAFVFFASCSGNQKEDSAAESHGARENDVHSSETEAPQEASEPQFQVEEKFREQLAGVFTSYLDLKDAFVASDADETKEKAKETASALADVDMKLLSGAAHNDWMNYQAPLKTSLEEIRNSSDIESQRKAFSTVSDNLYKSIKAFGLGGKEAYYDYCPMAFNNEGAYWLSEQEKIRNPYFGDKMLTCGEVKEKLK